VALSAQCNRDDCWYFHPFGKDPTLWGSKGRCYFCGGPHMKMNCPHKVGRPAEWFIPPGTATHRGPMAAAAAAPQVIYDCLETLSLLGGRSSCVLLVRAGSDSDAALFCLLQTQMSSENELIALENAGRCYICGQVYAPLPPAQCLLLALTKALAACAQRPPLQGLPNPRRRIQAGDLDRARHEREHSCQPSAIAFCALLASGR